MTVNRKVNAVSMEAGADLSAAQYRILHVEDDGQVNINSSTATVCLGILLNKPGAEGRAAQVAIEGSIVKCEAGAAINERDAICAVAGGRGSAQTTAAAKIVGFAVTAAAGSGELFELEVNPQNL